MAKKMLKGPWRSIWAGVVEHRFTRSGGPGRNKEREETMPQSREKPCFTPTMMAAVPYRDMQHAADIILTCFPEAPCLPVLTRSVRWLLEGIPCLLLDRKRRSIYFDLSTERESELLEFYERYEANDLDYFATTPDTAPFFYHMIDRIAERRPKRLKWVAFHTAGPVLLGDTLKQADGTPSIYNETLRDVLIKGMNMKARWLERWIRSAIPNIQVIADLPETTLVTFTSSGGSGSREDIVEAVNLGFSGLDCIRWVHCCANIDWSLLIESNVQVINFDAYQHAANLALYARGIKAFLERGGMLGWGIVPVVKEDLERESLESLIRRLEQGIARFVEQGVEEELLARNSWLLPSCETVLLTPEASDRALLMTREISTAMREKYGFLTSLSE